MRCMQVNEAPTAAALLDLLLDSLLGMIEGSDAEQRTSLASKLMGLGSDGASVLTGEFNGLIAKLQQRHAPFVMAQHDAGHRTNLAAAVLDDHALFVKLRSIVSSASTFFQHRCASWAGCMNRFTWALLIACHA